MLFGFLPASHPGQERNDKSQQLRQTPMLSQRLTANRESAIRPPPFFQRSDPGNPGSGGPERAPELPHSALKPGKPLIFPVVSDQSIAIRKRVVLVAGGLAGGHAKAQQRVLRSPLFRTEVSKHVPAVRRQRLAPD